jgi:pyridoxamine 5'-phosphate oxidase
MGIMTTLRDRFRSVPSVTGSAPAFDPDAVPADPQHLLRAWIDDAISAGVVEPLAITVATVDADGTPDARVLIVKDVDDDGALEIATVAESAKVAQLEANPRCAVSVYWPARARQIRLRGVAERKDDASAAADFAARSPQARALVEQNGEHWTLWRIVPSSYEFWQGDPSREHLRVGYKKGADGWSHRRLRA